MYKRSKWVDLLSRRKGFKKHSWNPYTSDIHRLSIYPSISVKDDATLKIGDNLTIYIDNVDDHGRGTANYRGFRLIVYNATVGSRVTVRVKEIRGRDVICETIKTHSEADVEY